MTSEPWNSEHDAVLRSVYPSGGAKAVSRALNGLRTEDATRKRAIQLKVKRIWSTGQPRTRRERVVVEKPVVENLFEPNRQAPPLSDLNLIGLYPWGYMTSKGELKPSIGLEVAA